MNLKSLLMWLIAATVLASCNSTPQQTPSIIPEPLSVRMSDGNLELDGDVYISINDPSLEPAAGYVTSLLSKFGIKASTKGGGTPLN
ncbi:MAG: glycoside hydrolase family 20 zincin-like fold domain-containing protein, partial [Rikenellaceae bacterium]|nr:glycoside hydrolase family 20 zincin-like fold domain-containing protein [Rikenellaceae bacterium]